MRRAGGVVAFLALWWGLLSLPLVAYASADDDRAPAASAESPRLQEDFGSALAAFGEWVTLKDLGIVWRPLQVARDWVPYRHGSWTWTERGWFWVTDEPWGWATYHFGRWAIDQRYGWVWCPGSQWAPAWVSWRWSGEVVGWAPLPPKTEKHYTVHAIAFWTFMPASRFSGEPVELAALPMARVPAKFLQLRNAPSVRTSMPLPPIPARTPGELVEQRRTAKNRAPAPG